MKGGDIPKVLRSAKRFDCQRLRMNGQFWWRGVLQRQRDIEKNQATLLPPTWKRLCQHQAANGSKKKKKCEKVRAFNANSDDSTPHQPRVGIRESFDYFIFLFKHSFFPFRSGLGKWNVVSRYRVNRLRVISISLLFSSGFCFHSYVLSTTHASSELLLLFLFFSSSTSRLCFKVTSKFASCIICLSYFATTQNKIEHIVLSLKYVDDKIKVSDGRKKKIGHVEQ